MYQVKLIQIVGDSHPNVLHIGGWYGTPEEAVTQARKEAQGLCWKPSVIRWSDGKGEKGEVKF